MNESNKIICLNKYIGNNTNNKNLDSTNKAILYLKSEKSLYNYDNNKLLKIAKLKNEIKETYYKNELKRKNKKNEQSDYILKNYGIKINEYLKIDLDDMDFDDAIKYDKRTFFEYFCQKFKKIKL